MIKNTPKKKLSLIITSFSDIKSLNIIIIPLCNIKNIRMKIYNRDAAGILFADYVMIQQKHSADIAV